MTSQSRGEPDVVVDELQKGWPSEIRRAVRSYAWAAGIPPTTERNSKREPASESQMRTSFGSIKIGMLAWPRSPGDGATQALWTKNQVSDNIDAASISLQDFKIYFTASSNLAVSISSITACIPIPKFMGANKAKTTRNNMVRPSDD